MDCYCAKLSIGNLHKSYDGQSMECCHKHACADWITERGHKLGFERRAVLSVEGVIDRITLSLSRLYSRGVLIAYVHDTIHPNHFA